jgi:hypothetical protein
VSPVKPTSTSNARSVVLAVIGVVLGLGLVIALFVFAIPSLTESGTTELQLGSDTFDAGDAADRSETIADSGPILFPDVAGNQRDIYLQHVADDPASGWLAFDARRPGTDRTCTLEWTGSGFTDPCGGPDVPPDGQGLVQYTVEVTEDGDLSIAFEVDDPLTTEP